MLSNLWQDIRYALRMLVKRPAFTIVAALAIALGITANTSIFSFVDAVIIRPLPYPEPEQLVGLGQWRMLRSQYVQAGVSAPNVSDIQRQNSVFQEVGYYLFHSYNLTSGNPPERLEGAELSVDMLKLLGVQPEFGRSFTKEEAQPGREKVAILGYGLWQRQFGGKADVLGKTIQLDDASYTVIGVMPRNFYFIWDEVLDVITPLALPADRWTEAGRASRDLQTMARLKRGVTLRRAQSEMDTIAGRLAVEYPDADKGWGIKVEPLHGAYHRHIATPLIIISIAALLVLLIACVNVANLLLVRATTRRKEIALRMAMGASAARLVSQLLTESVLLGLLGGLAGVLFSYAGVQFLAYGCARYFPVIGAQWIGLNGEVLAFCLGLALLTGLIFGLVPAIFSSRMDLNEPLKESGASVTAEAGGRRLRNGLVASEVCLAMVLMVVAGLLIRTFVNVLGIDVGFDPHNVLSVTVPLPRYQYSTPAQQAEFFQAAIERIRALPGVVSASGDWVHDELLFNPEGSAPSSPEQEPSATYCKILPRYFQTMRTPLIQGRDFTDADNQASPRVAIINETLVHRYFPNANPIGHLLIPFTQVYDEQSRGASAPLEIVGVVKDVKYPGQRENRAEIFVPLLQQPIPVLEFDIRTAGEPLGIVPSVREALHSINRELPLGDVDTLENRVSRTYGSIRFPYVIVWIFAGLAFVLTAVGIFGVISYSVSQRTREMAIRLALGADRREVLRLVLTEGLKITAVGIAIGVPASLALGRLLQSALYQVPSYDLVTLVSVTVAMAGVAVIASYFPALRATKVDPLAALRCE
ncbi:MAG TPA: ABC transporter permease [Terriglobales bacterium]|nr:ABC transporter permease [Terriglobales bacterium]